MQKRRCSPNAVQRACLVAANFLHTNGQAKTVHFPTLAVTDAGVLVGAVFHVRRDIGQCLGAGDIAQVKLGQGGTEQAYIELTQFFFGPAQIRQVVTVIGNVVRGGWVCADHGCFDHTHPPFRIAGRGKTVLNGFGVRGMAVSAVFFEQGLPAAGEWDVHLAKDGFWPGRRLQLLQGFFQGVQVMQTHTGGIPLGFGNGLSIGIEQVQGGAYAQGFADIACHWLHGRAVPLHPVKFPDVPHLRITDRGIGNAVVAGVYGIAKYRIGDSAKGIGSPKAFFSGVKAAVHVIEGSTEQTVEHLFEVTA